ncbi:MAG: phage baseplate plug protein [Intestinimonas sp.]
MKLIESGQEVEFIDIDRDRVPCSLLIKLIDRTYRMTFRYNEVGDFFTVDLETVSGGSSAPLVYGEVLRCGKPLFEAFNDERYPLPVLCPCALPGMRSKRSPMTTSAHRCGCISSTGREVMRDAALDAAGRPHSEQEQVHPGRPELLLQGPV